ncbi:MAG: HAMP domain-containing histidine kinase [Mycoplasmataceae bacterium]|nr:HAMP domain-containing histidine kinase [Mycoplasmataceae bacterium]
MRESKFLKTISYILIPFLILIIGLSLFYEFGKDIFLDDFNEAEYFDSDTFLTTYMYEISKNAESLIYHNDNFTNTIDNDLKICYRDVEELTYNYINFESYLKENYFLIQYKDLAITNVEFTTETDTIEEIKAYINNVGNDKYFNIVHGNIESNSEIFSKKAIRFFEDFKHTYYSIEAGIVVKEGDNEVLKTEYGNYDYDPYQYTYREEDGIVRIEEIPENEYVDHVLDYVDKEKVWYTTDIKDFEIYSTYKEELVEYERNYYFKNLIKDLKIFENYIIYAIPISSVLLILLLIYLCIAIGYTKNKEGIDLNGFDKIPIEIVWLIGGFLVLGIFGLAVISLNSIDEESYNLANSLLISGYFISYILCAIIGITTIKRIKAKILVKESLTGKICIWCFNLCKKIWNAIKKYTKKFCSKIKTTTNEISKNWPRIIKIMIFVSFYILLCAILIWAMEFIGLIMGLLIGLVLSYFFIEDINCYDKIEKHLKGMYEGINQEKLDEKIFTKNFKEIVKYINDISKGFENAREEGVKSERLKTELITNVSHDIKTPLTSIINYVDLLKKENIESEKAKEYIDVLDNKSQRLKKLTEDLVEASKASSGNVKLNIEKINVVELIKQSIGEFEDKFKLKELDIISEFAEDEIYINADNRYMYRIIENLFSNISKYAQEKSRVYVEVKRIENKVRVDIKNISKERLNISSDELMQRFVRGDKSRTTEGSGLGLSISKSLTELQKGTFEIKIDGDLFKVELEFDII